MGNFLTIEKIDPMWYLFHDNHLVDREFFFTEVSTPLLNRGKRIEFAYDCFATLNDWRLSHNRETTR